MSASISLQQWRERGQRFEFCGKQIFYIHEPGPRADSPTLLLIHGFPTASWDWAPLWTALAERFELVALDLLGFGDSDKPRDHRYSIMEQADLCEALMAKLQRRNSHVLAHDYGDTVAQELLARCHAQAPGALQMQSLALLNGGLFPECHRARPIQKLLNSPVGALISRLTTRGRFERSFAAVFGASTQPSQADMDSFWSLVSAQQGQRISHLLIKYIDERRQHRSRWVGALQHNSVPTVFINGLDDPVSGAHMAQRYRALIPDPQVVELPGIGHYPQVEAPDAVLSAYQAFIDAL